MTVSRSWTLVILTLLAVGTAGYWLSRLDTVRPKDELVPPEASAGTGTKGTAVEKLPTELSEAAEPASEERDRAGSTSETHSAQQLGRVSGTVVATGGGPIAGASLAVSSGDRLLQETSSDGRGRFLLEGLPLSPVELVVHVAAPSHCELDYRFSLPADSPFLDGVSLTMPSGVPVEGIVVDAAGRPVEGASAWARVRLHSQSFLRARLRGLVVQTDSDGRFRISAVPITGELSIHAWKPGYALSTHDDVVTGAERLRLELLAEGETVLEVTVRNNGAPAPDLPVELEVTEKPFVPLALEMHDRTDPDGRVSFAALPGQAQVVCRLLAGNGSYRAPGAGADRTLNELRGWLKPGEVNRIQFLPASCAFVEGQVRTREGEPVGDQRLELVTQERASPLVTRTDSNGSFGVWVPRTTAGDLLVQFELPAERWDLAAESRGYQILGEEPVELLVVPSLSVRGRVLDPDGAPIAGARVKFPATPVGIHPRIARLAGAAPVVLRKTQTDQAGRFELLVPASAGEEGFRLEAAHVAHRPARSGLVGVRDADDVLIRMRPTPAVWGQVLRLDGSPASGIDVRGESFRIGFGQARARTNAEGRFRLHGLGPGRIEVFAWSSGLRHPGPDDLRFGDKDLGPIVIQLHEPWILEGEIVDRDGRPHPDMTIEAQTPSGIEAIPARSDSSGRFRLTLLPDEGVTLRVSPHTSLDVPDQRSRPGEVEQWVAAGTGFVSLVPPETGGFEGRVILGEIGTGAPFELLLLRDGGVIDQSRPWGADGRFTWHGISPGSYELVIESEHFASIRRSLRVEAGITADLGEIPVEMARPVRVRVQDSSGQPIAGAVVKASSRTWLRSDERGVVMMPIAADEFWLRVEKEGFAPFHRELRTLEIDGEVIATLSRSGSIRYQRPDAQLAWSIELHRALPDGELDPVYTGQPNDLWTSLAPGHYRLRTWDSAKSRAYPGRVIEGQSWEQEIELEESEDRVIGQE